jgi:subtilisin family serine protease
MVVLNEKYQGGLDDAKAEMLKLLVEAARNSSKKAAILKQVDDYRDEYTEEYLCFFLEGQVIREIVKQDAASKAGRAIHRIWPDFEVKAFISKSICTIKADAARISFSAYGKDIVWAVIDSGIEASHLHFRDNKNLELPRELKDKHRDFTGQELDPLKYGSGHGTHVAGIIAGQVPAISEMVPDEIKVFSRVRDPNGETNYEPIKLEKGETFSGIAPRCKLLSLRVLDDNNLGNVGNLISALKYVQKLNQYGRRILVHGVNMSLGYEFMAEWFACGQSPLCIEVDRLVRSGVVVVVAAGNTGYGTLNAQARGTNAGLDLTINDPGNAAYAITVGSTHRDKPYRFGVSYFSSKGPTGDGRLKPDLIAPGEKIISCGAGRMAKEITDSTSSEVHYLEYSGTSMAAPHVSGAIAAFLSIRPEFIGQPERVKEIFMSTATDLKRDRNFQGAGLVDLLRAIQSV